MGEPSPLRRIEEAGFNAWPALQTNLLDGWVLRFADGYTKRANSINPTYPSDRDDLADHVSRCEAIYRERRLQSGRDAAVSRTIASWLADNNQFDPGTVA